MKKILSFFVGLIWVLSALGQSGIKLSSSFSFNVNKIIYDGIYPIYKTTGIGLGLQLGLSNQTIFKPIIEIDWDRFAKSTDMVSITLEGKDVIKHRTYNLFMGSDFRIYKNFKMEVLVGPSFLDSYTYLGLKSAMIYSFGKNERFFGKVSLTYIRTLYDNIYEPFAYMTFSAGIKIF
jgi:hypothetical protein